jgi:hypothetical protein
MTLGTILLVVVILMPLDAIPTWPHSRGGVMGRAVSLGWYWSLCSCWCCWVGYSAFPVQLVPRA